MISPALLAAARCPSCRGALANEGDLYCRACDCSYHVGKKHLDLRPPAAFAERTKYLDEELHLDRRHEHVSPPLLSAGVRNDMLRKFLALSPGDRVIDLGCGSGRVLVWNHPEGAWQVGVDVSPFFAAEALETVDLVLGDLRRLPFEDGTFNKAYSLDVFEHMSREGLRDVLREAARVLEPGGRMFVYSHVRRNSRLAVGLRLANRLARRLERAGLVDLTRERLRKSDHLNPLADIPDLERTAAEAGFRISKIRYYTPLVGAFVENILVRVAERWLARRAARPPRGSAGTESTAASHDGARSARAEARRVIAARGPIYVVLKALTAAMKIDVWLFGRVESGPFFALLTRNGESGRRP
ncbi:MAG: methyltransferase domain-containing protein [Vicinamibacterales bacterium]